MEDIMLPTEELLVTVPAGGLIMPNIPFWLQTTAFSDSTSNNERAGDSPMSGGTTVEVRGRGVVDDLVECEALVLGTGSEGSIAGLVAHLKLSGLRDGMVVCVPDKVDGVAGVGVNEERHVAQYTLRRGNNDSVGHARARAGGASRGRRRP